jgi:predicted AlkP superfamily phosphohydrolase/phosphomutase
MPHLARLRAAGATARGAVTSRPARTAAGHAALLTGAWSDENGIDGNDMPLPGRSVLEIGNGYSSAHLRAEPLWVTAARQGLQVTVVSATQVYPFEPFGKERRFGGDFGRRLTLFDGYQNSKAHDQVLTAASLPLQPASGWRHPLPPHEGVAYAVGLEVAGQRVAGLLYDSPEDEVSGLDTLDLRLDGDTGRGITLKPRPAAADPLAFARLTLERPGGQAGVHFRLFELSPDGSRFLLYGSAPHVLRGSRPRTESPAFEASGGFVGNGASRAYSRGELGPTLPQGGDGTAERRYLETVALVVRQLSRLNDFAIENTPWDVIITYLPCPDEFLHLWLGYLDPDLPGHDPELGSRLRPFVDEGLALVDRFVGHLADRIDADTLLAVASDHGQVAVSRVVRPNVALVRAGLLALDPEGEVDLARTRALYFPGNSGHVLVNSLDREGGIVTPEQEPHVRQEVVAALRSLRDPTTGEPVVRGVFDARSPGAGHGTDGPSASDLFLSLAPGYRPSPEWHGELTSEGEPWGDHLLDPERREMWAAFALAGPGVAAGVDLGTVRLIDVAPTLCALLGIDPPAAARGQILAEALQRQLPGR